MEIIFSDDFKKDFNKLKNKSVELKIIKQLKKLATNPHLGKPLRHNLKHHRSLRVHPYRIIYRLEQDKLIIVCFDH
ncbi:type II toxin-antitoxin system RelE/ParE family toxin [Candidatus Woesearchaeota archaeon]|nr:type II toxin-antitoxin system RelE/ParE family toxin [Candidatus Woesearchaeota archaeon]